MRAYGSYGRGEYKIAMQRLYEVEAMGELPDRQRAEVYYLKGRCLLGLYNRSEAAGIYDHQIRAFPNSEVSARAKGRLEELRLGASAVAPSAGQSAHHDS